MFTGQISSHALQLVHAHSSSAVIRSNSEFAEIVISASMPIGGGTTGLPVAAITSPVLSTISRGSSGLPVAWAGHTLVQRPHIVQASVSSSCFHVKSSTTDAPNVSSSVSARLGSGFIAPFGRSWARRYMFSGDVNMCRSIVNGRMTRKATKATTWAIHAHCVDGVERVERPPVDEPAERPADEAPLLVVEILDRPRPSSLLGDAEHLGGESGEADGQQHAEDHGVLRAGLDADAVRTGDVAADDRPHHAADEHEPGEVGDEGVRLIGAGRGGT